MTTKELQEKGAELQKTLAQKAWESSNFKEQLIKNPISTIESVTGNKIQSGINIKVEDQTDASKIYLNIPRKIEVEELELTDEQLEMVAGGTDLIGGIIVGAVVVYTFYRLGKL
jgi:hypothetical protein